MHIDKLQIGTNIEIEVKFDGQTIFFQSDIVSIKGNSIFINTIMVNDQTIGFSEQCQLNFLYKSDGKVYIWENISIKLIKYNGVIYHMIDLSWDGKPYNRRDSYRTYIGEDIPIFLNTPTGSLSMTVLLKDISETGAGFITNEVIDLDRTVRLKLKVFNTTLSLSGTIVRKEFLPNINATIYGCKFSETNQMLGKYIAKKQLDQLRKNGNNSVSLNKPILLNTPVSINKSVSQHKSVSQNKKK